MEKPKINSTIQILQLFTDIAQRVERCYDFEIQYWLTIYENFKSSTNFAEAALIIINAAYIFGHKVDFLKTMILNIESLKSEEKKGKPIRENITLSRINHTTACEIDFTPKTFTRKEIHSFQEIIEDENQQTNKDKNKYDDRFLDKICQKYTTKPLIFERMNLIQTYGTCPFTYGKRKIYDKDFNDIDSRWNYKVYSDCIVREANVICRPAEYERNLINKDISISDDLASSDRSYSHYEGSLKPFHLYLPIEELKSIYDVDTDRCKYDYSNMKRYQDKIKSVLSLQLEDLYCVKDGRHLNFLLNGTDSNGLCEFNSTEPLNSSGNINNSLFESTCKRVNSSECESFDEGIGSSICTNNQTNTTYDSTINSECPNDSEVKLNESGNFKVIDNEQLNGKNVRQSFDEGICSGFVTPNSLADLDPVVDLYDIFNHVKNTKCFSLNIGGTKMYKINILNLPMANGTIENFSLRRKPKIPFKRKLEVKSEIDEKLQKVCADVSPQVFDDASSICESDFCGFLESDILLESSKVAESTILCDLPADLSMLESSKQQNSSVIDSQDSGFCEGEELDCTDRRTSLIECSNVSTEIRPETVFNDSTDDQRQLQLEITRNVKNWHDSLKSVLLSSEKSHIFDIEDVKKDIMNLCSRSNTITFNDVMENQEKSHTARYFFGVLQLANMNALVIEQPKNNKVCKYEEVVLRSTLKRPESS